MEGAVKNLEDLPAILTVSEVGKVLRFSRAGAYCLVRSPGFPAIKVGRRLIVPKVAFLKWLESRAAEGLG
jgi:excisionase family DNA binding protein